MKIKKLCIFCCFVLNGLLFADGLVLQFETRNIGETKDLQKGSMYISGENIRMQIVAQENKNYTIFRADKQLLWAIDDQRKEYSEITKESIKSMGQKVNTAMQQMEAQMAQMPPEQRAMMEQMMKGQVGAMQNKPMELTFKNTNRKKTINNYPCTGYEEYRDNVMVRELWVTPWNNFASSADVLAAFKAMGAFFNELVETFKNNPFMKGLDNPYSYNETLNGFPVVVREFEDGKATLETEFKQGEKKNLDANLFLPPKGYTMKKLETGDEE